MATHEPHGWTTQAEFDFVDQLASKSDAITLLQGYLAGMTHRVNFGQIDPIRVTRYAHDRLNTLLRKFA